MELPNRKQLDSEAEQALASLSDRQRIEARKLMGNPPNIDNIPESAWQQWREELDTEIAAIILLIFMQSAEYHGLDDEELSLDAAREWSLPYASAVSRKIVQATFESLSIASSEWNAQRGERGTSVHESEVRETVNRIFGRDRMSRVGRDLVTSAQTAGGEWSVAEMVGLSLDDWWQTNPGLSSTGPCSVCSPLHGQPRYVWETEFPNGPPAHPNCVCEIRYVNLDNAGNN